MLKRNLNFIIGLVSYVGWWVNTGGCNHVSLPFHSVMTERLKPLIWGPNPAKKLGVVTAASLWELRLGSKDWCHLLALPEAAHTICLVSLSLSGWGKGSNLQFGIQTEHHVMCRLKIFVRASWWLFLNHLSTHLAGFNKGHQLALSAWFLSQNTLSNLLCTMGQIKENLVLN